MPFEKFPFKIEKQFRLQNWDYSTPGFYFVTICTHDHNNYFGEIKNNNVELNQIGLIASQNWIEIPYHFSNILLDQFIIMPDHIHGILIIDNIIKKVGTHHDAFLQNKPNYFSKIGKKSTQTLPVSIKLFKSSVKMWCNQNNQHFQWQPRFHDRIIRTEKEYFAIKQYIKNNPKNWDKE